MHNVHRCLLLFSSLFAVATTALSAQALSASETSYKGHNYSETALPTLRKLAFGGDGDAQAELANRLLVGNGVTQDKVAAKLMAEKSADSRNPIGLFRLAHYSCEGDLVPHEAGTCLKLLQQSANGNYLPAIDYLAAALFEGKRVDPDLPNSFLLASQGANLGSRTSQLLAGVMLRFGIGTAKNESAAAQWFEKASSGDVQTLPGDEIAIVATASEELGQLLEDGSGIPKDEVRAQQLYQRAADNGNPAGQREVAYAYKMGIRGIAKDPNEAVKWYRKAATGGDAIAQNNLGHALRHGVGVEENQAEAREWYAKAAEQGNATAQLNLAIMLEDGQGGPKDLEKAFSLYKQSADSGNAAAQTSVGWAYEKGSGTPIDLKAALVYYEKAAAQGDATAENNLGTIYAKGLGVPADVAEARNWYRAAAAQGSQNAVNNLAAMDRQLGVNQTTPSKPKGLSFLQAFNAVMGGVAQGLQNNSQPNAIEEAKNRGLRQTAEIAAAQQRPHVAAIPQQGPAASTTARIGASTPSPCSRLAKDCLDSQPTATSPASPTSTSTPMAAVRNAPIVPDPIYAATPASGVCPPSGYYMSQTGDVSVGIPCSPGKPLPASGSQGSAPFSTGGSGNAGQSGTNGNLHHLISPRGDLQQCVTFDFNGQTSLRGQLGWDRYSNTCQQAVNVTVVFQDGRGGASEMDIDAGKTGGLAKNRKEYADHGGSSYYVCPAGYGAADVQGNYLYKTQVTQYMCRQHGW